MRHRSSQLQAAPNGSRLQTSSPTSRQIGRRAGTLDVPGNRPGAPQIAPENRPGKSPREIAPGAPHGFYWAFIEQMMDFPQKH